MKWLFQKTLWHRASEESPNTAILISFLNCSVRALHYYNTHVYHTLLMLKVMLPEDLSHRSSYHIRSFSVQLPCAMQALNNFQLLGVFLHRNS
ncbi:hypothetical protein NQZ68_008022 [Dissostichus eleginoides]|nr:hypothetical protein NQZ68_008022 [Dissostichus eleginoides]